MGRMKYISSAEWSRRHGYSRNAGLRCIERGKVPEAQKVGNSWAVPEDLPWPGDKRFKK